MASNCAATATLLGRRRGTERGTVKTGGAGAIGIVEERGLNGRRRGLARAAMFADAIQPRLIHRLGWILRRVHNDMP